MLINKDTRITGKDVILVPYKENHVETYHKWMHSEELQQLTASLPLTLEEEYEMQKLWMTDETKCTFIILDKALYETSHNEVEAMIGDTNFFFASDEERMVAEAEIMIAEPHARGKHRGWQAMLLMFLYGINYLTVQQFVVKILITNVISIAMFQKMGFTETSRSHIFGEVTMNRIVDADWMSWLKTNAGIYDIMNESDH